MQNRERLSHSIYSIPTDNFKASVLIKVKCFLILLVHVNFIYPFFMNGKINQTLAISPSLLIGMHEKHFYIIFAQS